MEQWAKCPLCGHIYNTLDRTENAKKIKIDDQKRYAHERCLIKAIETPKVIDPLPLAAE